MWKVKMVEADKIEFIEIMTGLAGIFNHALSRIQINLYFDALRDLDFKDVKRAANIVARTCKFFPKPVEFREQILPNLDAQASLAYDKLHEAYLRFSPYHSVIFDDPVIHAVVNSLGGWLKLASLTIDEAKWYRKDFEAKYKHYAPQVRNLNVPTKLVGQFEIDNSEKFPKFVRPPQIIGDEVKALTWTEERKALQAKAPDLKMLTGRER